LDSRKKRGARKDTTAMMRTVVLEITTFQPDRQSLKVDLNKIPISEPPFKEIVLASDAWMDDGTHINILLICLLCRDFTHH